MYISEKFLVDFYGKIRRSHTVLARSKLFEEKKIFFFQALNFLKKKCSVSLEKDFIFRSHIPNPNKVGWA